MFRLKAEPSSNNRIQGRSAFQIPDDLSSEDRLSNLSRITGSTGNPVQHVQQYDRQGHPQNIVSRGLVRQSRRAQNDVLTAIGVCVRVDKNGKPITNRKEDDPELSPTLQATLKENDYGLFLATADWALFCLADLCLLGLRQRLQVGHN